MTQWVKALWALCGSGVVYAYTPLPFFTFGNFGSGGSVVQHHVLLDGGDVFPVQLTGLAVSTVQSGAVTAGFSIRKNGGFCVIVNVYRCPLSLGKPFLLS